MLDIESAHFFLGVSQDASMYKLSLHRALLVSLPTERAGVRSPPAGRHQQGGVLDCRKGLCKRLGMNLFL